MLLRDAGAGPLSRRSPAATTAGFFRVPGQASGIFRVRRRGQPWHGGCSAPISSIPAASSAVAVNGRGGSARHGHDPGSRSWSRGTPHRAPPDRQPVGSCPHPVLPVGGAGLVPFAGARRQAGDVHRAGRHLPRPGGADRPVLDGAHPAGEDRPQAPPSAVRGHPHAVPALAGVRRAVVAVAVAVGLLETGHATRWPTARTRSDYYEEHGDPRADERRPDVASARATRIARLRGARASPADLQALRADLDALEAKFARDEVR